MLVDFVVFVCVGVRDGFVPEGDDVSGALTGEAVKLFEFEEFQGFDDVELVGDGCVIELAVTALEGYVEGEFEDVFCRLVTRLYGEAACESEVVEDCGSTTSGKLAEVDANAGDRIGSLLKAVFVVDLEVGCEALGDVARNLEFDFSVHDLRDFGNEGRQHLFGVVGDGIK
jgi:hypothetical protein